MHAHMHKYHTRTHRHIHIRTIRYIVDRRPVVRTRKFRCRKYVIQRIQWSFYIPFRTLDRYIDVAVMAVLNMVPCLSQVLLCNELSWPYFDSSYLVYIWFCHLKYIDIKKSENEKKLLQREKQNTWIYEKIFSSSRCDIGFAIDIHFEINVGSL